ncbi:exosortase F system-associated membrane protein [Polaribacter tangerinus]|uniref:exosortase F system-associated membrane protein n=1 Tax=Polaribacter tangerinus TaxID=1920034 RepID=UPI000B4A884F|nr:exosortase F system-associated protein [Polaribacter tangerinus]
MKKNIRILLIIVAFCLLFLIRAFANKLFYDPLITYFKNDYLYAKLPTIDFWQLLRNLFYRFVLNSFVTLLIIGLLFRKKELIKFTALFLAIAFVILIVVFAILLNNKFENGYLLPFYIRRFIIHPLFLLILIPAFYFQHKNNIEFNN